MKYYGYMRARARVVAAATGAALVVVPLTGAAGVAVVADQVSGDSLVLQDADAALKAGNELAATISTDADADFAVSTPKIDVSEDPEPVVVTPPSTSTYSSSSVSTATAVSNDAVAAAVAGSAVVAEAMKYVGTPYAYGGSSPSTGFDCSGFVNYVFGQLGISVPRTSGAFYSYTRVSNPQPGDLIVSPGHVAIYVAPGLRIDANHPGDVVNVRPIYTTNHVYVRVTG